MAPSEKKCIQLTIADKSVSQELTTLLEQHGYAVKTGTPASPAPAEEISADLVLCDQDLVQQYAKMDAILEKAGNVCHELNQPLQTVTGYCDLMMLDIDESDGHFERFDKIRSEAERMGQIARRLMNLVRNRTMSDLPPTIGLRR